MKQITCNTFLDFQYLSAPAVSPDGRYTAYIRQLPDLESNTYPASLWLYCHADGQDKELLPLETARIFTWLDAENILFSKKEKGDGSQDATTSYCKVSVHGGEAEVLFTVPVKGGAAYPLGDGRFVLTAAWDCRQPSLEGLSASEAETAMKAYREQPFELLEEVPAWGNGLGFTSGTRNRLCVYDPADGTLEYLTEPPFKVADFSAKDGKVLYIGNRFEDVQTLRNAVYVWDAGTGETRCLLAQDKYIVKLFAIWKDKAVLCLTDGQAYGNGQNGDFYCIDFAGGEPALLTKHDHHCVGSTVGTDCKLGLGAASCVMDDTLYYISTVDTGSRIEALDLGTGAAVPVTSGGSVEFISAAAGKLVATAFRENRLGELYDFTDGEPVPMTHANDAVLGEYAIAAPEYMEVQTGGDLPIQGWVMKPAGYVPGQKYPAILSIHGGPRLSYGDIFFHEMQTLSAAGYFVIFCNPRGSEGRGNAFADIRGRFGTIDYEDIMGFLDAALEKYPDIDPERLGVGGGSYGGFMTNWIIGHTGRFKAACSQRSICDWTGMEGTTDIGYYFVKGQIGASHREDHEKLWEKSPVRYLDQCKTPTLVLHSDQDYRCWTMQAYELFAALQMNRVPSRLCMFSGENHELSRSGRPRQKLRRLEEITAWYDKYLKG